MRCVALGVPARCGLLRVMRCGQALQDMFHAGQAGVEGDLDQPPPDLFAAVLAIGQVEGGIGEQVGSSGLARVRNRPQSVVSRTSGIGRPVTMCMTRGCGMARMSVPARLASAAVTSLLVRVASITSISPPSC